MSKILHFLQTILRKFFPSADSSQNYVPIPRAPFEHVPVPQEPADVTPIKPRKQRTKSDVPETLSELLDHLQITFDALRLPDDIYFLERADRKALRNLGVHVPSPWLFKVSSDDDDLKIDTTKPMPNIMCVSLPDDRKESGFMFPKFVFAIKLPSLPAGVAMKAGVPYIFGYAMTCMDSGLKDNLLWGKCFITINKTTGAISFCDEFQLQDVWVPLKNPIDRKIFGRQRKIVSRGWNRPLLFMERVYLSENGEMKRWAACNYNETKIQEKNVIVNMFDIWRSRDSRWSVAVKHGKNRVTFGIAPEHTKKYFADRDKSIKAKDGRAKRIIHYVRPHTRTYPSGKVAQVKEHIRGIAFFNWQGYECAVTAPRFNGMVTALFDSDPEWCDGEVVPSGMIDSASLGRHLADAEMPQTRH